MITVEKALQIVLGNTGSLVTARVPILGALGMTLAEDITSQEDVPSFNMSTIDGFAVRSADIIGCSDTSPVVLKLDREMGPGDVRRSVLQPGHARKVAAGSPLPEGADTIVSSEHVVRETGQKVRIYKSARPAENVYLKGADIASGMPVLPKGRVLTPVDIGLLAAIGKDYVQCSRRPKVSFFTSGNHLVSPDGPLPLGKMRVANTITLQCQLSEYGADPLNLGIVPANRDDIAAVLEKAKETDMLIASSGSSMSDFNLVKAALERMGMDLKFWKVAIKPGKPIIFGTLDGLPVFGLSANQISSMVVLEQFIRPAIFKMQGRKDLRRAEVVARLDREIEMKAGNDVTHFIRAEVRVVDDGFLATPLGFRTTPSVRALSMANGFIVVPPHVSRVGAGELVRVQIISNVRMGNGKKKNHLLGESSAHD